VFNPRTSDDPIIWQRKDLRLSSMAIFMTDALRDQWVAKFGLPAKWEHQSEWEKIHFMSNISGFHEWSVWYLEKHCRPLQLTETRKYLEIMHYATVAPDGHNAATVIEKVFHASEELDKRGCGGGARDVIEQVQRSLQRCEDEALRAASKGYKVDEVEVVDGIPIKSVVTYTFLDEKP
jgi:hypothetical protein